jgi:hypothetical protein
MVLFLMVEEVVQSGVRRGQLVLAAALMLLSLAALSAWYFTPIYPDEITFRLQLARYIPDQGMVHGLYALCRSNIKDTPLLFVIPAWVLSRLDLALSPVEMRILPFATVSAAVCLAIWYAIRGGTSSAAVMATTAFIGVAGSGLILVRYEYMQELNVVCCLTAFHLLTSVSQRHTLRYGIFALLLISSLLSVYAHVQGLLLLPLTFYLAYHIVRPALGTLRAALLTIMLLLFMAQTAIGFHHSTCVGYPDIEQFWARMTFDPSQLGEGESINLIEWVKVKSHRFFLSFQYKGSYAINYLPGIRGVGGWRQIGLGVLNQGIQIILLVNLLLSISVAVGGSIFAAVRYATQHPSCFPWQTARLGHTQAFALVLLSLPVIFLFFYDSAQNFYRSFFLNFLMAILLTLFFSRISLVRTQTMAALYFSLCGAVVIASLAVNVWWFTDKLQAGYEGPSISFSRDWNAISRDVKALAEDCDMDLSMGGIILDDMTYDSLKSYPLLYPATYMALSASIIDSTMADVMSKIRPNYAIARCDTFRGMSIGFEKSKSQLCCANFRSRTAQQ